jgi:hypothetical protein
MPPGMLEVENRGQDMEPQAEPEPEAPGGHFGPPSDADQATQSLHDASIPNVVLTEATSAPEPEPVITVACSSSQGWEDVGLDIPSPQDETVTS